MTEILMRPPEDDLAKYRRLARPISRQMLASHVDRDEQMELVDDFDPEHPERFAEDWQDPELYVVETPRASVEDGNRVANWADPRFDDMVEMAGEGQEAQEIIDEAGEIVADGGFIWVVTEHIEDLTDIAYADHILTNHLDGLGRPESMPEQTLLMLSMALSEGRYTMKTKDGPVKVPMIAAARTGFTKIVRTWQRTDSANELVDRLPASVVRWINANGVRVAEDTVEEGHGTGAMGPSGTTGLVDGATAPINSKTRRALTLPNAYMLGMTVWRQTDRPVARYAGRPVKIEPEDYDRFDGFFERLTADMNAHIPDMDLRHTPTDRSRSPKP